MSVSTVLAATAPAAAQEPPAISWRIAEGCPGTSALLREIGALLGQDWEARAAGLQVYGEITADSGGYLLVLSASLGEPAGARHLRDASCPALVEAAALVIALAVDPEAISLPEPQPETAPEEPPEVSEPQPDPPTSVLPTRTARRSHAAADALASPVQPRRRVPSLALGLGGLADFGTVALASPGVLAEVIVRLGDADVRARLSWIAEQSTSFEPPLGASVAIWQVGGSVHGCARPFGMDPGLALCGGVHAGALVAESRGISQPGRAEAALVSLSALVAFPVFVTPWLDIEVSAELAVPFVRPVFVVDALSTRYTPEPATGRLSLAVHFDVE